VKVVHKTNADKKKTEKRRRENYNEARSAREKTEKLISWSIKHH
jgi:hypothetical protein